MKLEHYQIGFFISLALATGLGAAGYYDIAPWAFIWVLVFGAISIAMIGKRDNW